MNSNEHFRKSIDEQQALQRIIATVQTCLTRPADMAGWRESVAQAFEHLRAHLFKHFALEESGGHMEAVVRRWPDRAPQIERLRSEHATIHSEADRIMTLLHSPATQPGAVPADMREAIEVLLRKLRNHESTENQLLQSGLCDDLGGPE